jgi:aminoglycoside phosphotransferase
VGVGSFGMPGSRGRGPNLVLEAGLERVGLAVDDFEQVGSSRGRCAYRAPALGLFARTDVAGRERLATQEVRFARWAAARSLPTVTTHAHFPDQPVLTPYGSLTLWDLGNPIDQEEPDYEWLGWALCQLHVVDATAAPSSWEPLQWLADGLELLRGEPKLHRDLVGAFQSEIAGISTWLDGPGSRLQVAAIHGDASYGNVIAVDGKMVLTDFETSGVGPVGYDLSAVRVMAKRFGLPGEYADRLAAASGVAIDEPDQAMLDRLYELVGISAVIVPHIRDPGFLEELGTRVASLEDENVRWTPHRRLIDRGALKGEHLI